MDATASWVLLTAPLRAGGTYANLGCVEMELSKLPCGAPGVCVYLHGATLQDTLALMEAASDRLGKEPAPSRVTMLVDEAGAQVEISMLDSPAGRQKLEGFYCDVFPLLSQ